jgi:type II secretory pathway component PulF
MRNGGNSESEISTTEFETIFAKADATLPHTMGGTPHWVDRLVSWAVIVVLLVIVVAIAYGLTMLFGG